MDTTPHEIINTLLLERNSQRSLALVVEGIDDFRLLVGHLNLDYIIVECANGKQKSLDVVDIVRDEGLDWVRVLVDADFDRLGANLLDDPPVVWTENYDLLVDCVRREPDMLVTAALQLSSPESVSHVKRIVGESTINNILEVAKLIAHLRYLVVVEGKFVIPLRGVNADGVVRAIEEKGVTDLVARIGEKRTKSKVPSSEISNALREPVAIETIELICDHDLVEVISAIHRDLGNQVSREMVSATLRAKVTCGVFRLLPSVQRIVDWASGHGKVILTCKDQPVSALVS